MTTQITIRPRLNADHLYDVDYAGERLVSGTTDPEHAAARALLARGITGYCETLDKTGQRRFRFEIEGYARTRMKDSDRDGLQVVPYVPSPTPFGG